MPDLYYVTVHAELLVIASSKCVLESVRGPRPNKHQKEREA